MCWCPALVRSWVAASVMERLDILEENMRSMGMNAEAYRWYADLRRYGTVPHAGFGAGFERLLMFVTGVTNIPRRPAFCPVPRGIASSDLLWKTDFSVWKDAIWFRRINVAI